MKKLAFSLALLSWVSIATAQHDPLVNNYGLTQHFFNPAYTGFHDVFQVNALTRQQWAGIEGAPVTHILSGHTNFAGVKNSLGVLLLNDRLGINNNVEISVSYGYKIDFGFSKLSVGLQGGLVSYQYDYEDLNLEDATDPFFSTGAEESFTKPNFGVGVFYATERYYVGMSVPKFLNLSISDVVLGTSGLESERFRRHYYFTGGYVFDNFINFVIKPHVLIRFVNGVPVSYDFNGTVFIKNTLILNALVRDFSTLGLSANVRIKEFLTAGYSFEVPLNSLVSNSFGTHELTLGLNLALFATQAVGYRYF